MSTRTGSGATPIEPAATQAPPVAPDLLLVVGHGRMSVHAIDKRDLVIGRSGRCDVSIDHAAMSRRHAIVAVGDWPSLRDLGSTNGTRIGATVLHGGDAVPLHAGASFQIGPFTFLAIRRSRDELRAVSGRDLLCIADPTLGAASSLLRDIAASTANVLILGETGTGKEVLATTLHELSHRSVLVRINCAALSETLLESELFGHEKGAFTGATAAKRGLLEAADGGTAFLDEIGELPPSTQAKLLRAVEHREVLRLGAIRPVPIDVRFVAATNRDLQAEVDAGRFRRDLYFRLDGVSLAIPPLRDRRTMIGPLALLFFAEACRAAGHPQARMSAAVLAELERHEWPGNVRELKAVIDRAVLLSRGRDLAVDDLVFAGGGTRPPPPPPPPPPSLSPSPARAAAEEPGFLTDDERADRDRVIQALDTCGGNQTRAAKQLQISRTTLVNKLRLYRIPRPRG
jgi:transcriptional regulator with GAF, ATPase, and Fis domain